MDQQNKLSEQDLARVQQVTSSGYNATERKPFRGWLLAGVCAVVVVALGATARAIAVGQGYLASFF